MNQALQSRPARTEPGSTTWPWSMGFLAASILATALTAGRAPAAEQANAPSQAELRHLRTHQPGGSVRRYHVCLAPDIILKHPDLLRTVHEAGVGHVWIATFFYGYWPYGQEQTLPAKH